MIPYRLMKRISILLVVALSLQALSPLLAFADLGGQPTARAAPLSQTDPPLQAPEQEENTLYLPAAKAPGTAAPVTPQTEDFTINSPMSKKVAGTFYFAVEPAIGVTLSSVTFKAGETTLGTDTTPADGFSVLVDAKTLPAGVMALTAIGTSSGGVGTRTMQVEVVPNPPSSATVGADGAILATEIGSVIAIRPGDAPEGTQISVDEKTQQEVSDEQGIDWEGLGVTFLGAQEIETSDSFASALMVSSAGFGNRVQPGQAVVNYMIRPDADGDGVGELVVVNNASVAPNGDVVANPVEPLSIQVPATGISGPPGRLIKLSGMGFNSASQFANVGIWTSEENGQTLELSFFVQPDSVEDTGQIISLVIPPLAAGQATLTFENKSSGATVGPVTVTIEAAPPLPMPAADIVDQYLADTIAYFQNLQDLTTEGSDAVARFTVKASEARSSLAELVNQGLSPEDQSLLNTMAQMIANSGVYSVPSSTTRTLDRASASGYTPDAKAVDVLTVLGGLAGGVVGVETALGASIVLGTASTLGGAVAVVIAVLAACRLIRGGVCIKPKPKPSPRQPIVPQQVTGMGAAPPTGGPGPGDSIRGGPSAQSANELTTAAVDADDAPVIVKIYSRGTNTQLAPFTGVADEAGYFFIPLIPEGEPYTAVAYDPVTGNSQKVIGIGPAQDDFVYMFFDLTQASEPDVIRWDGAGDGTSWTDPLNWNTGLLPGPDDHVIIDVPGTVTVTANLTTAQIRGLESNEPLILKSGVLSITGDAVVSNTLAMQGAELSGSGTLTINGLLNWSGGTMSGSGKTVVTGDIALAGSGSKILRQRTLENQGTATWSNGYIYLASDAQFHNLAGATFVDVQTNSWDIRPDGASTGVFHNAGTYTRNATNISTIRIPFHNTGTVNVQTGTLGLNNGNSGGTIDIGSGTIVDIDGTFENQTGGVIQGTGTLNVSGATFTNNGTIAPTVTVIN